MKSEQQNPRGKINSILRIVARHGGVTVDDILGNDRSDRAVAARQVSQVLIAKHLGISSPVAISRIFGVHHTTVINSFDRIELEMQADGPRSHLYRKADAAIAAHIIGKVGGELQGAGA